MATSSPHQPLELQPTRTSDSHASDTPRDQGLNNIAFADENARSTADDKVISQTRWISRKRTNLDETLIDNRSSRQAEFIKRPRAHQYTNLSLQSSRSSSSETRIVKNASHNSSEGSRSVDERSSDNILKQLSRLDLFVDLVWVGIIANLSTTFSKQAFTESGVTIGSAILEFVLLFLPIWRIWDSLRSYCVNYYSDDILQRNFMVWILLLSVLYGINAPYAFNANGGNSLKLLIVLHLVARASFLSAYFIQCIFIPFLRRQFVFIFIAATIASAFWISAIYVNYPSKIALLFLANLTEHPVNIFLQSPAANRLLTPGWKQDIHIDHYVDVEMDCGSRVSGA